SGHCAHLGERATQSLRPCQISWCENKVHRSWGIIAIRSCSIFFGSSCFVSSRRRDKRCTCVSTTTPSFRLNHVPRTTLAVLRATPGSVSRSSMLSGTLPPKSLTTFLAAPTTDFDLLRKNPVERTSGSSSSGRKAAKSCTVGYFLKITGVTLFTFTSVDWAERMVATSNSQASL